MSRAVRLRLAGVSACGRTGRLVADGLGQWRQSIFLRDRRAGIADGQSEDRRICYKWPNHGFLNFNLKLQYQGSIFPRAMRKVLGEAVRQIIGRDGDIHFGYW